MRTRRRSGRFATTSRIRISRKSVMRSRSCTSSRITTLYRPKRGSFTTRRKRVPTVQNSTVPVSEFGIMVSPLMEWPISPPTSAKRSQATRCAKEMAAMRRGCVTTIRGTVRAHAGLALRTRVLTSMSGSSSPPSKYFAKIVDLSSATSSTSQAYQTSSYSTSTVIPTSRFRGSSSGASSGRSIFHSRQSSRMNCGSCVDLPLPVPPLTTTTLLYSRALPSSPLICSAGN
mmetsp:Transcript_9776/g.27342  ORF Transcript_9776/g.27342 Transcript_9776/m.27342 type:complete len:230 (-) Transcript_9776:388-1077(-)